MDKSTRLGTDSITSLMFRFSIPAVSGMLVNALYNVVDRIFVGQGVNENAIAALSVCGVIMTIVLAFSMLIGAGSANLLSIRLGEGRKEDAKKVLATCFVSLIVVSFILTALCLVFMKPLLVLFGAKDALVLGYATEYMQIIAFGFLFQMVAFGLNHCTRAQGFPVITMVSMLLGAVLNMVLDPIFIFVFQWGVSGAAFATILSQFASMVWMLIFNFGKKPEISIRLRGFRYSFKIFGEICLYGSGQFCIQIAASLVATIYNNVLHKYGGAMAQSAFGIVISVSNILLMPLFGINQGAQPILGYNYGAKNFARVKKTFGVGVLMGTVYALLGYAAIIFFPGPLVSLFVQNGSQELMDFAKYALFIYHLFLPVLGFQVFSTNYFLATGRPKTSMVLSLLRQVIILAPMIVVLPMFFGLAGVMWATPVSDFVTLLITLAFIFAEAKKWKQQIGAPQSA